MNDKLYSTLLLICSILIASCSGSEKKNQNDDILVGELPVVVDETLLPLFLEQKEVFESSYYNAKVKVLSSTEVQAVNTLLKGDSYTAFLTRELSLEEKKYFENKSIPGKVYPAAYDAIVIVGHVASADTSLQIQDILGHLSGNVGNKWDKLVFDNLNSSLLRYFLDLGKITRPSALVEASGDSKAVLEAVANSPGKIGFVSLNQYLSLKSSFSGLNKIRILSVLNESLNKYVLPSQASLSTDEYPLKRTIYMLNYQPNMGLGVGFSAFVTGDRGQRIILKAGLLPVTMPGREIIIRDGLNL